MLERLGAELRAARRQAGLSLETVGAAVALSHAEIGRIERDRAPWVPITVLARIATVVGLDLSARAYPGPQPLRDAAHSALLAAFLAHVGPGLRWRTEVPLPEPGDRRAWDAMIFGSDGSTGVEGETEIHDAQALERRIGLKQRESGIERVVLVVADTRANRAALRAAPAAFIGRFPVPGREVLAALEAGTSPAASGLVLLRAPRVGGAAASVRVS